MNYHNSVSITQHSGSTTHLIARWTSVQRVVIGDRPPALIGTMRPQAGVPLFDTPLFTRHIEAAYTQIYERYLGGLPPDHIHVM